MTSGGWNFADVWECVARVCPDAPAMVHDDRVTTWRQFDLRAGRVAAKLQQDGVSHQGKVALYLRNGPAYMETAFAAFKAALVPVNTNYRYGNDEVHHVWSNADVEAVVFDSAFTPVVEALRSRLPGIVSWICVDSGSGERPDWVSSHAAVCETGADFDGAKRSGDDLVLIYTGGTTGLPKGVMWRQHDLYMASNTTADPEDVDLDHVSARIAAARSFPVGLSAAPLMHGTGFVFAATVLSRGGCLASVTETGFDADRLLDLIARQRVSDMCIVGDAFALPIAERLDAEPDRWDVACLKAISSSGMVWSASVKRRLLRHMPDVLLIDFLNSSEASGMGRSISSNREAGGSSSSDGPRFRLGRNAFVIDDAGNRILPGDPTVGRLAVRGHIPLGYYKDARKTAETFPVVDGVRCSIPGDFAIVSADGAIELRGRGSTTINTGGEKVFAEEVEAVIKTCPGVRDALVVGVPDPRFGQIIAAAVETRDQTLEAETVIGHVRQHLARYKAPRHVMLVPDVGRTITGKPDYPAVRARIESWLRSSGDERREVKS